jgi:hypothetical protein
MPLARPVIPHGLGDDGAGEADEQAAERKHGYAFARDARPVTADRMGLSAWKRASASWSARSPCVVIR